jgi:hypothetical protein
MILSVVSVVAAIGCGDTPPRRITAGDITPIPPGTAIGSVFAGNYTITAGRVQACYCRVGSCDSVRVTIGSTVTVVQTDGTLQIGTPTSPNACMGGIDADGNFHCNGAIDQPGDMEYGIASGQIQTANGQPTLINEMEELTATVQAILIDCDFRFTAIAEFAGPIAALPTEAWAPGMSGFLDLGGGR